MNGLSGRYPTRIHFSGTILVHRFEPLPRKRISIAKLREMEEEDDDIRAALEEAFGESSSSSDGDGDDDEDEIQLGVDPNDEDRILGESPSWERVGDINGLWICREFLSPDQQSSLLSAIDREGWFTEASCNQAMRFGDLPQWAMELAYLIREVVHIEGDKEACILPSNILWREPVFDQLIVNVYQPGEGICAHVDLMRFDDGIAIISLESSCVMHFTRVKSGLENIGNVHDSDPPNTNYKGSCIFGPRISSHNVGRSSLSMDARDKSQTRFPEVGGERYRSKKKNLHNFEEALPERVDSLAYYYLPI